ncbi:glycosyltransferase family 2 protein [Desulfovibrio sp. SGI.169]|uniref:glycosyltransferase family 2 protein n=1 Tax=Desulfovibrio sp. SGI.169 TaxID=3420561 RepID=UPI003CFFEE25
MRVSVIIPAWNLWEMTAACLRSLANCSRGENLEVLVVDNGSTDATARELEPLGQSLWGADFRALRLPENLGFAKACNLGARAAAGELLFFLNNDATCTPDWLPPLRAVFEDARLGAAGPLLLYPDGTAQHCGIMFSPFFRVSHIYERFPGNHPLLRKKRPLQAITGAALMVRRQLFSECGGFFEGYQNGFEDMELCYALADRGYRLTVVGESALCHHTSQTPGRFEHDLQNGALFYQRRRRSIRPDMHCLARLDGYEMRIGPALSCWLALPETRERELDAAFSGASFDAAACAAQLEREPLWRGGWLSLMDHLEAGGRWNEARMIGERALHFFSQADVKKRLLRLLRKLGLREQMAQRARDLEEDMRAAQADGPSRRALVQGARREAYAEGDAYLAALLSDWLEHYGKTDAGT